MLRNIAAILMTAGLVALTGCGGSHELARSEFVEFTPEQKKEIEAKSANEYRIQSLATWRSPRGGRSYPSRWNLIQIGRASCRERVSLTV